MNKDTLSVHTQTAQEALRSLLKTLTQESLPLEAGPPAPATQGDALREELDARLVLHSEAQDVFIALSRGWVPLLSEGMLGERMEAESEGAADLMQEIVAQAFGGIQTALAGEGVELGAINFTAAAPGDAPAVRAGELWRIPFSAEQSGDAYDGFVLLLEAEETLSEEASVEEASSQEASEEKAPAQSAPASAAAREASAAEAPRQKQRAASSASDAVDVAPAAFEDLGAEKLGDGGGPGNFELLAEVDLEVTVELGRRRLPLADVLKLTTGSVVELEKLVGEPLSVYANGRLIAEGEAVVIDEQFGVRITGLASKDRREKAFF